MGASATARDQALDSLDGGASDVIGYLSLHTSDPGTTGANEMSGVTRVAVTFTASSGGGPRTNSAAVTVSTPGTDAATHIGLWSAATGGTFGIGGGMTSPVTATSIVFDAGSISLAAS